MPKALDPNRLRPADKITIICSDKFSHAVTEKTTSLCMDQFSSSVSHRIGEIAKLLNTHRQTPDRLSSGNEESTVNILISKHSKRGEFPQEIFNANLKNTPDVVVELGLLIKEGVLQLPVDSHPPLSMQSRHGSAGPYSSYSDDDKPTVSTIAPLPV